jgi:hypothetical protein
MLPSFAATANCQNAAKISLLSEWPAGVVEARRQPTYIIASPD